MTEPFDPSEFDAGPPSDDPHADYRTLLDAMRRAGAEGIAEEVGAPQGLSYGQRQSEQMVNKSLSVAAKYIKFRGFVRLDELEVTGSPLVMFHPRSS